MISFDMLHRTIHDDKCGYRAFCGFFSAMKVAVDDSDGLLYERADNHSLISIRSAYVRARLSEQIGRASQQRSSRARVVVEVACGGDRGD